MSEPLSTERESLAWDLWWITNGSDPKPQEAQPSHVLATWGMVRGVYMEMAGRVIERHSRTDSSEVAG